MLRGLGVKKHEILIVECRSASDVFEDRAEGRTLQQILTLQGVGSKYVEVADLEHFVKAAKMASRQSFRYVHISAHGAAEGLYLYRESLTSWREFDDLAWPHFKDMCLCLSACDAGLGASELFEHHKTFCNVIIAAKREITWGEGLVAFAAFYHRAMSTRTAAAQDVRVLNSIVGPGTFVALGSPTRSHTYSIG